MLAKANLRKAFDLLNWDFLLKILQAIGVPVSFLTWIKLHYFSLFLHNVNVHRKVFSACKRGWDRVMLFPPIYLCLLQRFSQEFLMQLLVGGQLSTPHPVLKPAQSPLSYWWFDEFFQRWHCIFKGESFYFARLREYVWPQVNPLQNWSFYSWIFWWTGEIFATNLWS